MYESEVSGARHKLTKGEKCILAHLSLTTAVTVILLIIYLIHVFVSDHSSTGAFDTRRSFTLKDSTKLSNFPIGLFYYAEVTAMRSVCNALLLTRDWSASAGHCVAMRSDPHLSYMLSYWRIKYPYDDPGLEIIRSIVHPHFNSDTFANNVGLVQHHPAKGCQHYKLHQIKWNTYNNIKKLQLAILNWNHAFLENKGGADKIVTNDIQVMEMENCTAYVAPIVELRIYEFCVVLGNKVTTYLEHGAIIVDLNLSIYGIFTWGERENKFLPLVVLNLSHFKEWIESVTLLTPLHG